MISRDEIHVDAEGNVIPRPEREDFATEYEYVVAWHDYVRRIESIAWKAFDEEFQAALKRSS